MFKSRLALAALFAALLSIFAASAANAQYAPPAFSGEVDDNVGPGEDFTATFKSGGVNCVWALVSFQGQTAPGGSGATYVVTLTAPEEDGTYTITANCTWDPENENQASAPAASGATTVTPAVFSTSVANEDTLLAVPQTDTVSVQLVVGDAGDDDASGDDGNSDTGALPDTGGSSAVLLAAGAGLVVVGAGVTIAARRRKSNA